MSALEVVTDPRAFFERNQDDVPLGAAAVIVLIVTGLAIAQTYLTFDFILQAMPAEARELAGFIMGAAVVGGIVAALVMWLVVAGILHALSAVIYDGDADFTDTLAITGWGYVPRIVGGLVGIAIVYYVFQIQGLTPPDMSSQAAIQQYSQQIQNRPIFLAQTVFGIVVTVWSGFIWAIGISEVHDIELSEGAVVAGVPVVLSVLFSAYGLLGSM